MSDKTNNSRIITIGEFIDSGKPVTLDLNYLIELKLLSMAMTGGGKSHGDRVILEESFEQIQHIIIDGENEYYTLREKFPYLLFGSKEDNADVPIQPKLAEVLPETLMRLNKSAIIDISELKPMEREIFVSVFLKKLLDIPKSLRHPCLVMLDESQKHCPEKGYGTSISSEAVKDFVARCRKRKFTAIFSTQRPAALSKDVTGACGMKLIGFAGQEEDRNRNARELGMSTKPQDTMIFSKLGKPNYHFFAVGNGLSAEPQLMRFKKTRTHPPDPDAFENSIPPATPKQLQKVLADLQNLPQQAEEEIKTKDEMKKRIFDLERQLAAEKRQKSLAISSNPKIDPAVLQEAEQLGFQKGSKAAQLESKKTLLKFKSTIRNLILITEGVINTGKKLVSHEEMLPELRELVKLELPKLPMQIQLPKNCTIEQKLPPAPKVFTSGAESPTDNQNNGDLTNPEIKILKGLLSLPNQQGPRIQVAFAAGYASSIGGGFKNPLGALRSKGLVEYSGEIVIPTQPAKDMFPDIETMLLDKDTIQKFWVSKLPGPEQKIIKPIIEAYPEAITRDEIAEKAGYQNSVSGGFKNPLGHLRSLGLVEYRGRIDVIASKELFSE